MSVDVENRLSQMDEAWRETDAKSGGTVPPGVYQATISRFDFIEGKDGYLLLKSELTVTSGNEAGQTISVWHALEERDRLTWTKGYLELLGLENVEPFSTLERRLQEVLDTPVEIRVKEQKKDGVTYTNVYVNKRLGPAQPKLGAPLPGEEKKPDTDDEDIPF